MRFSVVSLLRASETEAATCAEGLAFALARLPPHGYAERARLCALQTCVLHRAEPASAQVASLNAHSAAQRAGDEASMAWALSATAVAPARRLPADERVENCEEALLFAQRSGDHELLSLTYFLLLSEYAENGRMADLNVALNPAGELLMRFPWLDADESTAWFRCLRAILDGQLSHAEDVISAQPHVSARKGTIDRPRHWLGHLATIRWLQGRLDDFEALAEHAQRAWPHETVWSAVHAWARVRQGRPPAVQRRGGDAVPSVETAPHRDRLATLSFLALTSADRRDRYSGAALRSALRPFRDRLVMTGYGGLCFGPVHIPLARLNAMLGDVDDAIAHYRAAISLTASIGAHPWLAEAQIGLAHLLPRRDTPAAYAEAERLARDARATARALHLTRYEERAEALLTLLGE